MDVIRVDLDGLGDPEDTRGLTAPILPQWRVADPALAARATAEWGFACRLPSS